MSAPWVYTPDSSFQPGPYSTPALSHSPYSPFIPDLSLYPPSPYSGAGSIPPSPNAGYTALPTGGVPFPTAEEIFFRQRRPSWSGPAVSPPTGLFAPQSHVRSNSFGQSYSSNPPFIPPSGSAGPFYNANWAPNASPWNQPPPGASRQEQYIHPWLNGETPRSDFRFNLGHPTFTPSRVIGANGQTAILGAEELAQPATYPPIFEIKITCDRIPQWPIILAYQHQQFSPNPYFNPPSSPMLGAMAPPPITVGDVLVGIHRELHRAINHAEWAELNSKEASDATKAFVRRTKALGPAAQAHLVSQGVKRVDYLGTRVWFRGLVRKGLSLNELTLITSST